MIIYGFVIFFMCILMLTFVVGRGNQYFNTYKSYACCALTLILATLTQGVLLSCEVAKWTGQ